MTLDDYLKACCSAEPARLADIYRRTQATHLYPRMCTGHVQGRLLAMLSQLARPRRIVEVGTFTGYSALCLAEGLAPDGELHTVEIDDEAEAPLLETFAHDPRIRLHIGDARQVIDSLEGLFDLALIDANKRQYVEYYKALMPKMRPGALIIADNTLWGMKAPETALAGDPDHSGMVAEMSVADDAQTRGIQAFNAHVAADPRVEAVLVPLRDGITLLRVK